MPDWKDFEIDMNHQPPGYTRYRHGPQGALEQGDIARRVGWDTPEGPGGWMRPRAIWRVKAGREVVA